MENLKIKNIIILFMFTIMLTLTGCYDKVELEDRGFIMAIGIDKYDEQENYNNLYNNQDNEGLELQDDNSKEYDMAGFTQNGVAQDNTEQDNKQDNNTQNIDKFKSEDGNSRFNVTINKANAASFSGNTEDTNYIAVADNETIAGALSLLNINSKQNMYLGYTEVIVLGHELLKDQELLKETIDTLERNREISREVFILATEGKASDILSEEISSDKMVGRYISQFYRNNNGINISRVFNKDLENLAKSLYATGSAIVPSVEIENSFVKVNGIAVIKNFKLIELLSKSQIKGYLWVIGGGEGLSVSTKYNDVYVPLNINKNKTEINFKEENGNLICEVNINIVGSIEGYNFDYNGVFDETLIQGLSESYEDIIEQEIHEVFNLFQNNYLIDVFEFTEMVRKKNNDIYRKFETDEDLFQNMQLKTNVSVNIKSIGSIK